MRVHARQSSFRHHNREAGSRAKLPKKRIKQDEVILSDVDAAAADTNGISSLTPSKSAEYLVRPRAVVDAANSPYRALSARNLTPEADMMKSYEVSNNRYLTAPTFHISRERKHDSGIGSPRNSDISCCDDVDASSYICDDNLHHQMKPSGFNEDELCVEDASSYAAVDYPSVEMNNHQGRPANETVPQGRVLEAEQDSKSSCCISSTIETQDNHKIQEEVNTTSSGGNQTPDDMYHQYHCDPSSSSSNGDDDNHHQQQHHQKESRNTTRNGGSGGGGGGFQSRLTTSTFLRRTTMSVPRDDLRLTIMVGVVLASFMLCWAPITIINFVETVLRLKVSRLLNIIAVFMMFLSAAINPIIYGLMNRNSRRTFYRMFCGCTRRSYCRRGKSNSNRNKVTDVCGHCS